MTRQSTFELMRDLVDHELVDVDGVSCGQVDDVDFSDDATRVTALLVGAAVWSRRLPALARVVIDRIGTRRRVRVPFGTVATIDEVIRLKVRATELGLGVADRKIGKWLARLPMS